MSKHEVISRPYFPVLSPNTGKYGPEITPYLNTFHAVVAIENRIVNLLQEEYHCCQQVRYGSMCEKWVCFYPFDFEFVFHASIIN